MTIKPEAALANSSQRGRVRFALLPVLLCLTGMLGACPDPEVRSLVVTPHENRCAGDTVNVRWDAVGATTLTATPATEPAFSNKRVDARGGTNTQIMGGETTFVVTASSNNTTARREDTVHTFQRGERILVATGRCLGGTVVYSTPSIDEDLSNSVLVETIYNASSFDVTVSKRRSFSIPSHTSVSDLGASGGPAAGPYRISRIDPTLVCPRDSLTGEPTGPLPDIPPLRIVVTIRCYPN